MMKTLDADVIDAANLILSIFLFSFSINVLFLASNFLDFFSVVSKQHNLVVVPVAGWCGSRIPLKVFLGYIYVDCDGR
jgi:hypothetical protein